jgi:uncharacterized protein (DUF3084 family)
MTVAKYKTVTDSLRSQLTEYMNEVDHKDQVNKQLKATLDTVRRILDDRIQAYERLQMSHKCLLDAIDKQPADHRVQLDLTYNQLMAKPDNYLGGIQTIDRERELLEERAREIERREKELEDRELKVSRAPSEAFEDDFAQK